MPEPTPLWQKSCKLFERRSLRSKTRSALKVKNDAVEKRVLLHGIFMDKICAVCWVACVFSHGCMQRRKSVIENQSFANGKHGIVICERVWYRDNRKQTESITSVLLYSFVWLRWCMRFSCVYFIGHTSNFYGKREKT